MDMDKGESFQLSLSKKPGSLVITSAEGEIQETVTMQKIYCYRVPTQTGLSLPE
jgi:hypothetical protein